MKCPTCPEIKLVMTDRQGIEIDYCPECRGVWLDRGELDKLIEKSAASQTNYPPRSSYKNDDHKDYDYRRKKSFLSELFD